MRVLEDLIGGRVRDVDVSVSINAFAHRRRKAGQDSDERLRRKAVDGHFGVVVGDVDEVLFGETRLHRRCALALRGAGRGRLQAAAAAEKECSGAAERREKYDAAHGLTAAPKGAESVELLDSVGAPPEG